MAEKAIAKTAVVFHPKAIQVVKFLLASDAKQLAPEERYGPSDGAWKPLQAAHNTLRNVGFK